MPSVAPVMTQILPFMRSRRRHDLMNGLPGLRGRRREYRAIDDARVISTTVEEAAMAARLMHDQHAGGMVPRQRARMQRELREALRDRHIFETAAALIMRAANTATIVERPAGPHAGFGAAVGG